MKKFKNKLKYGNYFYLSAEYIQLIDKSIKYYLI